MSRDLVCAQLELDQVGWRRVIKETDACFESIFEEQDDAKIRTMRSPKNLFRSGILQLGFVSPRSDDTIVLSLVDGPPEPLIPFPERLAPIFADDLCREIVMELNASGMSVMQFHRELADGRTEWAVRHRFGRLKRLAWVGIEDILTKGAVQEHIYRATRPTVLSEDFKADVPDALRQTAAWAVFERLSHLVKEAILAGTFDLRDDRHLSWSIVNLDLIGWENVAANLESLEKFAREEERHAKERIGEGAQPIDMTLGLGAYEAPKSLIKAP
jgi:hypothetical protein